MRIQSKKLLVTLATLFMILTSHASRAAETTASSSIAPANVTPTQLPAVDFYQMPTMEDAVVSPDGNYIVALKNIGDSTAIATINVNTGETFYAAKTDNNKYKFNWVRWANNDRLLVSIRFTSKVGVADINFSENRLVSIDAKKASEMVNMVKPRNDDHAISLYGNHVSQFQDKVLGRVPGDSESIFLAVDQEIPHRPTVYKVNVNNAKTSIIKKADARMENWYLDAQGIVRAGIGYNDEDQKVTIRVLDPTTNKWGTAWEYETNKEGATNISILGFGKNPSDMYILADYKGRQAIYKADLSKANYPKELILNDDEHDIDGRLIYAQELNDVVGLYYNDGEDKSIFWQADYKKFQASLDKALPGSSNYITSLSDDGRKYTLRASNGISPSTLFYGNRDTKQLSIIALPFPNLTAEVLVKKELLTYKARDGLELEGYLSRPKNMKDKPIATIILPHGGPMAEDGAGFDSFSSFLANRGYAVFQPNFRGSSGRGHEFMMKAMGAYGLAMQDDLEDAVTFLVEKKIADPKRVGIVGASYGGYAALMGATKTPDLFQCAVSFAGISDLKKQRAKSYYFTNKNAAHNQYGNNFDQLEKTSPINMVEKIKIPILLIHGDKDIAVPMEQSRIMADELKSQHKTYEYIKLDGGTHYLDNLQHRKQTFEAMDAFLKKYLPAE